MKLLLKDYFKASEVKRFFFAFFILSSFSLKVLGDNFSSPGETSDSLKIMERRVSFPVYNESGEVTAKYWEWRFDVVDHTGAVLQSFAKIEDARAYKTRLF